MALRDEQICDYQKALLDTQLAMTGTAEDVVCSLIRWLCDSQALRAGSVLVTTMSQLRQAFNEGAGKVATGAVVKSAIEKMVGPQSVPGSMRSYSLFEASLPIVLKDGAMPQNVAVRVQVSDITKKNDMADIRKALNALTTGSETDPGVAS